MATPLQGSYIDSTLTEPCNFLEDQDVLAYLVQDPPMGVEKDRYIPGFGAVGVMRGFKTVDDSQIVGITAAKREKRGIFNKGVDSGFSEYAQYVNNHAQKIFSQFNLAQGRVFKENMENLNARIEKSKKKNKTFVDIAKLNACLREVALRPENPRVLEVEVSTSSATPESDDDEVEAAPRAKRELPAYCAYMLHGPKLFYPGYVKSPSERLAKPIMEHVDRYIDSLKACPNLRPKDLEPLRDFLQGKTDGDDELSQFLAKKRQDYELLCKQLEDKDLPPANPAPRLLGGYLEGLREAIADYMAGKGSESLQSSLELCGKAIYSKTFTEDDKAEYIAILEQLKAQHPAASDYLQPHIDYANLVQLN